MMSILVCLSIGRSSISRPTIESANDFFIDILLTGLSWRELPELEGFVLTGKTVFWWVLAEFQHGWYEFLEAGLQRG